MNFWKSLKAEDEKRLAAKMVEMLVKELPPALLDGRQQVLSVNRVTRVLERVLETAKDHQRNSQLGVFGRARLANHFKWELKNHGYLDDFVEMATEGLVMELTKVARTRAD
jgi:hypothetical protein